MDYVVLGNSVCGQPIGDPYVVTSSWMCVFELVPLPPVMLIFRIWYVNRKLTRLGASGGGSQLRPILHILVDAGAIYSVTLLVALICFVTESNGQYVILDMVSPPYPVR